MPDTDTLIAPPETAPQNPFSAALDKAFRGEETAPPPEPKAAAVVEKPKVEAPKTGVPKELFPAKADKTAAPKSAIDEIAEPGKLDVKGRAGWDALKKEAKAHESERVKLQGQIDEWKAKGRDPETLEARLAEREAKLAEYDGIVTRARLDDHPDFRREFIDGRAKLIERAQTIIDESGGDKDAVATALNLKGKARVEALRDIAGDLDNFQSGRLGRVIDELTDLDTRGDAKRATAADSYKELQEQERQREVAGRADLVKRKFLEFEDTTRRMRGELEVLNKADGHDAWNAEAEAIVRDAKEYMDANPHADIEKVMHARAMPVYRNLFLAERAESEVKDTKIAEMEAELKAIHGRSPGLASRGAGVVADNKKPFSSALSEAFGGQS